VAKTEIVENIGGDFGQTVVYEIDSEYIHHVDFRIFAITGRSVPEDAPLYERKGAESSTEHATDWREAARYVDGSVKWDGCSHLYFGDEEAYLHLCGRKQFDNLTATLIAVYERCGELMSQAGVNLLEDEFEVGKAAPVVSDAPREALIAAFKAGHYQWPTVDAPTLQAMAEAYADKMAAPVVSDAPLPSRATLQRLIASWRNDANDQFTKALEIAADDLEHAITCGLAVSPEKD